MRGVLSPSTARKGVVSPPVHDFTTQAAGGVGMRRRLKNERRDVSVEGGGGWR